jgi:hypothetical protein
VAGHKLIHDSAARADKLVFRLLAEQGELGSVDLASVNLASINLGSINLGSINLGPISLGPIGVRLIHRLLGEIEQRVADRYFNRSGGTQSRTQWHVAIHQQVRSIQALTRPDQYFHNANYVIAPVPGARGWQMVEIELNLLGIIFGMNHKVAVRAWRNRGSGIETDRCRHDEAVVVIGVFTD